MTYKHVKTNVAFETFAIGHPPTGPNRRPPLPSETGNYLASGFMSSNQLGVGATPMAAGGPEGAGQVPVAPAWGGGS